MDDRTGEQAGSASGHEWPRPAIRRLASDHIKSGDLLDQHDEPQRAIAVYVRHLERCQAKMKLAGVTGAGEANLQTAIGRLKGIAEKLLRDKQFALAVECSERALEVLPDNREFQAIRAKAKMLERETLDRPSSIFQQRDENIDNKSWGLRAQTATPIVQRRYG